MTDAANAGGASRGTWRRWRWPLRLVVLALLLWVFWSVGYPMLFRWYTGERTAWVEYPSSREISRG